MKISRVSADASMNIILRLSSLMSQEEMDTADILYHYSDYCAHL